MRESKQKKIDDFVGGKLSGDPAPKESRQRSNENIA